MPSHYDTLQVTPSASDTVIKAAYRALAQLYHPDHNPGNVEAESMMKDINHAYQILSNASSRAQYDIQHGLGDYANEVDDFAEAPAIKPAPAVDVFTAPPPSHDAQPGPSQIFFQRLHAFSKPANWPLRIIFFVAAAVFSLMAAAKWIVNANPDLAVGTRKNEMQELKLQIDKSLLYVPES
jgi:DnaJ domain